MAQRNRITNSRDIEPGAGCTHLPSASRAPLRCGPAPAAAVVVAALLAVGSVHGLAQQGDQQQQMKGLDEQVPEI